MKFSINDLVVIKTLIHPHTSYSVNRVCAILDDAYLTVGYGFAFDGEIQKDDLEDLDKPGSRHWREGIQRYQEHELFSMDEAVIELRRLENVKSKLESDFESTRPQIQERMNKAAALVKEAVGIIKPLDKEFYDLTSECKELYLALKDGGWSHSTMSCKFGR